MILSCCFDRIRFPSLIKYHHPPVTLWVSVRVCVCVGCVLAFKIRLTYVDPFDIQSGGESSSLFFLLHVHHQNSLRFWRFAITGSPAPPPHYLPSHYPLSRHFSCNRISLFSATCRVNSIFHIHHTYTNQLGYREALIIRDETKVNSKGVGFFLSTAYKLLVWQCKMKRSYHHNCHRPLTWPTSQCFLSLPLSPFGGIQ